jgi:hypothetical protein
MKNVLIFTNLLLLGIAFFFGYHYFRDRGAKITTASCVTCTDYSQVPYGGLNAKIARDLSGNYKLRQLTDINAGGYIQSDARSVWFPLDTIKRFIWEIEKGICTKGCAGRAYGIRLYFAAYPDAASMVNQYYGPHLTSVPQLYEKHHTLFMVPTYTDATSNGPVDFDPWHMNGCNPVSFDRLAAPALMSEKSLILLARDYRFPQNISLNNSAGGTGTGTVQNHGGLCPPICTPPTGTSF